MIEFKNVCLKYNKEYYALFDLNFKIENGETILVLGQFESGKTTLIRIIAGLEKEYSGEVYINDIDLRKLDYAADLSVGYVLSIPVMLDNKTVMENMMYALRLRDTTTTQYDAEVKISQILEKFKLSSFAQLKVKTLSNYEKYLLSFARLSLRDLDILLVDNIFKNLTKQETEVLIKLIKTNFLKGPGIKIFESEDEDLENKLSASVIKLNNGSIDSFIRKDNDNK